MGANVATIRGPSHRAGIRPGGQRILQVVLVLAISLSVIVVLATLQEPGAGVDERTRPQTMSEVDTRWTPKWGSAAAVAGAGEATLAVDTRWTPKWASAAELAGEAVIADTRWTAKEGRAEAASLDRSEARGSEGG